VIVCVPDPTTPGVYVTEQDADPAAVPGGVASSQDELEKLAPEVVSVAKLTEPVGLTAVPPPMSLTVAVHDVA
jgi:hypothetical protein